MKISLFFAACWLFVVTPVSSQGLLDKARGVSDPVPEARLGMVRAGQLQAGLVAEVPTVTAGKPIRVGLRLLHDPHWHTYWRNPGDSGLPTRIDWELPPGWTVGPIAWPTPRRIAVGPLANYGYEGEVLLPMTLVPAGPMPATGEITLRARASWLVCKDVCIPGDAHLALVLRVATAQTDTPRPPETSLFAATDALLPRDDVARAPRASIADRVLTLSWAAGEEGDPGAGLFMPYTEGLILPAAAQPVARTAEGWRVDIPLGESSSAAVAEVRKAGMVEGIWTRANGPGLVWRATLSSDEPPSRTALVHPGRTAEQDAAASPGAAGASAGLAGAILAAMLGGLILNLMPCVFPVIGLKVLSFSHSGAPGSAFRQSIWFAIGVIGSFIVLAALLMVLRSAGEAVGWGFQLQSPLVVLALALLFVAISLNLFGVFEMGTAVAQLGNLSMAQPSAPDRSGPLPAIGSGVLAVVVASPCTAPFMGGAIGFTATAGPLQTVAVFAALGIGMALPYVILAVSPGLLRRLPRPGPWMVRFRQLMAFPMLSAAAWLFWVLTTLQGPDVVLPALLSAVAMAMMLWIYGDQIQPHRSGMGSWIGLAVAAAVLVATIWASVWRQAESVSADSAVGAASEATALRGQTSSVVSDLDWRPWSPGLSERLSSSGTTVFVDFTASWCISCQANKVRVLQSDRVINALRSANVATLRADWTKGDAAITEELRRHGRNGVPLYLVFRPGETSPRILSEWLTEREVLDAIR